MSRVLILDNEPIQALLDSQHPKHRIVMAYLEVPARRNRRKTGSLIVLVPTTVRVEAGWDRTATISSAVNRLPITDDALTTDKADSAAKLRNTLLVSPADAHIGAVMRTAEGEVSILTSDLGDLRRIAQMTARTITIARI